MVNDLTNEMIKEYGLNAGAGVVGIAAAKNFISAPEGFKMVGKKWEIICFLCRKVCPYRFGIDRKV